MPYHMHDGRFESDSRQMKFLTFRNFDLSCDCRCGKCPFSGRWFIEDDAFLSVKSQGKLVFSQVRCSPVPTCTGCSRTAPSTSCRRRSVGRNTSDSYDPHLVPSRSNAKRARQLFVAYFRVARIKVTLLFFFIPFSTLKHRSKVPPANIFAVQVRKQLFFFYLTLTRKS